MTILHRIKEHDVWGAKIICKDFDSGYSLIVKDFADPFITDNIVFRVRSSSGYIFLGPKEDSVYRMVFAIPDSPDMQFVEAGCGLGGFLPSLASHGITKTPIGIDPVDYLAMQRLLEYSRAHLRSSVIRGTVDELIARCQTMRDPSQVRLYNMTLGEALSMHPEIHHVADYVVDFNGPYKYPLTEKSAACETGRKRLEKILEMEGQLLKPDGTLMYIDTSPF